MFKLPVVIIKYWYLEAPRSLLSFYKALNKAFLVAFSLPLMVKTFFKPWKNEYREGLVGFSIFMGIVIKSLFILADIIIYAGLILTEVIFFVGFLIWPFVTFVLPFIKL
jgi:hypothetical protein